MFSIFASATDVNGRFQDIHRLRVNLKLLQLELYRPLLSSLAHILTKLPARLFPLLNSLVICGGSVHSDDLSGRVRVEYKSNNPSLRPVRWTSCAHCWWGGPPG